MPPSEHPTDPAPGGVEGDLAEALGAVREVSALAVCLETALLRLSLAIVTLEHRANTDREKRHNDRLWLVDLERRMRAQEGTAAE